MVMSRTPITLQQLTYFLSAVEHGSLSAAAEANYIAQPSLSDQIRRLERALGVSLFTRTNRRLILTEAARMLVPYAERTLAAAEEAVTAVDPIRNLTGGSVSFGTFSSAHDLINVDLIAEFRALYPGVSLRIEELNSVQVAEAVRSGDLEAGVVALPVDDRGLEISPVIWRSEACYYTAAPERAAGPIGIEAIARATLILPEARWGDMDPTRLQLNARAQASGHVIRPAIEVESYAVALELARRGVGDTIASPPVAERLGFTRGLRSVSLDPPLIEQYGFVWRRNAVLSPAASVLVGLTRALLEAIPMPAAPEV
ncbi:MAG: LysR family transcriptional regulator [Gordonia sp. (in: high G+C Gram-positive bacteria)]|uniref:LysR family transcriptional regulator n=1 Tax=Gordonia sp. (in: high G+C Gram-positive bacteria) TaxID=84139 RepID=UPI0039E4A2CA